MFYNVRGGGGGGERIQESELNSIPETIMLLLPSSLFHHFEFFLEITRVEQFSWFKSSRQCPTEQPHL